MKYGVRARWLSRFASGDSHGTEEAPPAAEEQVVNSDVGPTSDETVLTAGEDDTISEAVCTSETVRPSKDDGANDDGTKEDVPPTDVQEDPIQREADGVRKLYDGFDLAVEQADPRFVRMVEAGVPMLDAYRALHMDDILAGWSEKVKKEAEKRITDHVQARGSRPPENGAAGMQGVQLWQNVHQLTRKKRAEIASRAQNGEHISFR